MSRPPPLKKRVTAGLDQPNSNKEENVKNDLSSLKQVSKQELLEKMRSAKQEYLVEKNKALFQDDSKLNNPDTIRLLLNLLRDETVSGAKVIGDPSLPTNSNPDDMTALLQETKRLSTYIVNEIKSWNTKVDNLQAEGSQQWVGFIQSETTNLSNSYPVINHYLVNLQNDYNTKSQHTDSILNKIQSLSKQLKMKQEELQDCVESIEISEKRYDRSQSKIVSELMCDRKEETPVPVTVSIQNDVPKEAVDTQAQLEKHRFLIDIRTREVMALEKDIEMLQTTLDGLLWQVETLSDDKILGSNFVHHLESSIDFHYGRINYYEHKIGTLESEYDRLKIERKSLRDRSESEKSFQENIWATEMKNLKNNLERITSQYNHLKQSFHTQLLKENKIKEENDLVMNEVESQKQRMIDLEKEIELKRKDDGLLVAMEEANKLKRILDQINKTHGIMHIFSQYENKVNLPSTHETIQSLKQNFERLSSTHGDKINLMHNLLKQKQALLLMIDFFENTERQLYTQIDCDGRVYEGRASLVTSWINQKKEQLIRLQAENIKYSQTFPALNKEADKIKKNINNLKRISQQQAELIPLKESEEKVLVSQVNEQEILIRELECKIERRRLEVDDYTQESEEISKRLKVYDTQLFSLQKLAIEKAKSLDQEISLGKQVGDEYEKLKRKWTMISNGENPASQELIDEVEDLRAQFKCSTCKTRTRKCILLSCFHTFCNECIRTRLDTRQRRCPSCALNFGASDVKEFYLYNTQ